MPLWMISIGIVCGILGDVFLKKSARADWRLVTGTVLYAVAAFPVWIAYKYATFNWIAIAWQSISLSLALIVGLVVFGEVLTPKRVAALAFAIAAILILKTDGAANK